MPLTGSLWHLVLAELVFLASHSLTNRPSIRRMLGGGRPFTIAYSILSLLLLAWMIAAFRDAPTVVVWNQAPWMRWVPVLTMPVVCVLAVAGLTTPNPFSLGPGRKGYDSARPGILRLNRHPVLWAATLWAGAHMVPNGDLAALILFTPLLLLGLAGPMMLDRKRRRDLGYEEWSRLAAFDRDWGAMAREVGWKRVLGGLLLYAALIHLHEAVIGVSPWPI
jgi:uncharacterized membrane protein